MTETGPGAANPVVAQNLNNDPDPSHLIGLYQAERSDLTALYLASVAVLAFAATVLAAAVGVIVTTKDLSPWVTLLVPIPFTTILLYNAIVSALAKTRTLSVQLLEDEIIELVGTSEMKTRKNQILSRAGARVLDLGGGNRMFSLSNLACNVVIILTGFGFVAFSLYSSHQQGAGISWLIASIAVNSALLVATAILFIWGHVGRGLDIR